MRAPKPAVAQTTVCRQWGFCASKFGLALLSSAVFCAAISFFGRGVHEALAYSMVVFMLGRLDGLFLSKGLERLGVAKTTTYGWLAVQVAVVAAILF